MPFIDSFCAWRNEIGDSQDYAVNYVKTSDRLNDVMKLLVKLINELEGRYKSVNTIDIRILALFMLIKVLRHFAILKASREINYRKKISRDTPLRYPEKFLYKKVCLRIIK